MDTEEKKSNVLTELQTWYFSQCNGDWEHLYGVKIDTLDNPGWTINIDLLETNLLDTQFEEINIQRENEHDWVQCKKIDHVFDGACGPKNLEEMISIFLNWASSS